MVEEFPKPGQKAESIPPQEVAKRYDRVYALAKVPKNFEDGVRFPRSAGERHPLSEDREVIVLLEDKLRTVAGKTQLERTLTLAELSTEDKEQTTTYFVFDSKESLRAFKHSENITKKKSIAQEMAEMARRIKAERAAKDMEIDTASQEDLKKLDEILSEI